ncbi:MAG: hypothetical protein GX198_00995 [Epulopiscium sp.]|jgi:hypothetical protein|nr:hypothetical protein [Candidatus Epulonipiscium sp.]HPT76103.1 hypothetical protein [Defluviitaleaceae bacterium]
MNLHASNNEEKYAFEWTLTDNHQIDAIANYVKSYIRGYPKENDIEVMNVNLAYGVRDKEGKIFLTLIYYLSDSVMRTDTGMDIYKFIYIIDGLVWLASCNVRGGEIVDLNVCKKEHFNIVRQAIEFYRHDYSSSVLKEKFKKEHSGTSIYRYNDKLKKELLTLFKKELLAYYGEPERALQNKLCEFCEILNQNVISAKYTVESFRVQDDDENDILPSRLINRDGDIWLYFVGPADDTHLLSDNLETERLLFYYKGFVTCLFFSKNKTDKGFFKLNAFFVNKQEIDKDELIEKLKENGIDSNEYHEILQIVLNNLHFNRYLV